MSDPPFVPSYPYGDPDDHFQIDPNDFYKQIDAAFDGWYDEQAPKSNLGSCMPYELTDLEPEGRLVHWKDRRHLGREDLRKVNPRVAAEIERLESIDRPSKEDVSREFSPSSLTCYRAGFAEGVSREKSRSNEDWKRSLGLYDDRETAWAFGAIKRTVDSQGADFARSLLERVITEATERKDSGA